MIESAGSKRDRQGACHQEPPQRGRLKPAHKKLKLVECCASCSRTRCAASAWRWACRTPWSTATRSSARAWACASWARSSPSTPNCWPAPTPSSSTSCARPTCTTRQPGLRRALPVKSVGVQGDARAYECDVLRAVETIDFMTAHWAHLPYDFLGKVSNRIINGRTARRVSRVVYDIARAAATIEWGEDALGQPTFPRL